MEQRLAPPARLAFLLLSGVLLVFACGPLLGSGFLADDYRWLLDGAAGGRELDPRPLWIRASAALWGVPSPGETAAPFRVENLLLVIGCAGAWFVFLRRAWSPWVGPVHARAAGASAALVFLLHPFVPTAVASLEARADLLALFLGLAGAALFLWSRQEQRYPGTAASLVLLLLAGLCSDLALPLALLPVAAELLSARRHRRRSLRLRTTATTLLLFGGGAALAVLVAGSHARGGPGALAGLERVRGSLPAAVEDLGRQVLPTESGILGFGGVMLAGALLFLALQPAFRAARHAPRLWGGIAATWGVALAITELYLALGGRGADVGRAWESLPATLLVVALLGLTSSALRAERAFLVQVVLAGGYALLAHGQSRAWAEASREVAALHRDLVAASAVAGPGPVLVLDPPGRVRGVDPVGAGLPWLLHPRLGAATGAGSFDPSAVRGCSVGAFLLLVRLDEFAALCSPSAWVLAPPGELGGAAGARVPVKLWSRSGDREDLARRGALTQNFNPELDPLSVDGVRVSSGPDAPARELERLVWRTRSGSSGGVTGFLRPASGDQEGFFDLSAALAWRLAGPVRSLVLEQAVRPVEHWEVLRRLPALAAEVPVPSGWDWVVRAVETALPPGGEFVLVQLALDGLQCRESTLEREGGSSLRARGAERFAADARARGAAVAWSLDYRIGPNTLGRLQGRSP